MLIHIRRPNEFWFRTFFYFQHSGNRWHYWTKVWYGTTRLLFYEFNFSGFTFKPFFLTIYPRYFNWGMQKLYFSLLTVKFALMNLLKTSSKIYKCSSSQLYRPNRRKRICSQNWVFQSLPCGTWITKSERNYFELKDISIWHDESGNGTEYFRKRYLPKCRLYIQRRQKFGLSQLVQNAIYKR